MEKMIDPNDLQAFLNKIEGGTSAVDLLKIGQKFHLENAPISGNKNSKFNGNFRVALDIEDCLDRFYGGYYSDWACGGQWNRAYQFVQLLANAFKNAHVEVIAFFDGTLKKNKKVSFERNDFRQKTISVLKHIRMIGTPPPKIWWLPPSGIRTTLRNALRSVNIQVAQTVNDHTMEVIEYFHDQKLDAIIGLHPDYIIANTQRYFSSHDLRLSYKGALETKENMVSKLLSSLKLTGDHLPFVAVFLGGYILINDTKLKTIYERLEIDNNLDFEARIRKIAEIVRNSPTTDIDEFIKQLNLNEFETDIKESVEYYQRRGKFAPNHSGGNKKGQKNKQQQQRTDNKPVTTIIESTPFASETNENDEIARKILDDVSNLVNEEETVVGGAGDATDNAVQEKSIVKNIENKEKQQATFVYTLPVEVLKTSLTRHQRGIMDARIYQLLTKKEIILPQILEDEQYREIPPVHLFYRPARQMIYAILFNLYHQKYLCSNRANESKNSGNKKAVNKKDKMPEIQISEWMWSPQNEYKKADIVTATILPWAVPTVQRLWFGMAFEDKQRRMKAFLTVMRSDAPLMLNRGYVPQHMLVLACVLRYIITNPERNILTRQELDAFLAAAFAPQLTMVEYTQELVLPGVHLRGVYLATLFMQGVETASLANDACGVPLPWPMINPWLFFDGKLFHLKLKMSTYVATLRELCDDHIEIVLKIERFRKAILEDVEHFLLPAAHIDPMYRPGFLPPPTSLPLFGKNAASALPLATAAAAASNANNALFYNPQSPYFSLTQALAGAVTGLNATQMTGGRNRNGNNNRKGYQLKVGGIVTGSWAAANNVTARSLFGPPGNRLGNRLITGGSRLTGSRSKLSGSSRKNYGNKIQQTRKGSRKRNYRKNKKTDDKNQLTTKSENDEDNKLSNETTSDNNDNIDDIKNDDDSKININKVDIDKISEKVRDIKIDTTTATVELQNGNIVSASALANSMCDKILRDDEINEIKQQPKKILKNPTFRPSIPYQKLNDSFVSPIRSTKNNLNDQINNNNNNNGDAKDIKTNLNKKLTTVGKINNNNNNNNIINKNNGTTVNVNKNNTTETEGGNI